MFLKKTSFITFFLVDVVLMALKHYGMKMSRSDNEVIQKQLTRPEGKTVFHNDCISEDCTIWNYPKFIRSDGGLYKMMEFCWERPHQLTFGKRSKTRSISLHNSIAKKKYLKIHETKTTFKIIEIKLARMWRILRTIHQMTRIWKGTNRFILP